MRFSLDRIVPPRILSAAALLAASACGACTPSTRPQPEPAGQPDGCMPAPPGLLGWYRFDEAAGARAADHPNAAPASPLRLHASRHGSGRVLGALEPGRKGHAEGAADKNLGTEDFSIAVWLRLEPGGEYSSTVLDKRDMSFPVRGYHMGFFGGGPVLQLADGGVHGGWYNYHSMIDTDLADGEWHHLVVTVQRASITGVRWYLDGRPAGKVGDPTGRQGSLDSARPLLVGLHASGGSRFQGGIDELQLFNRVLPLAEVATLYARPFCR